ncbi:uncharacterized protein DSM5745_03129 [Aspergillus mulundensis]|uniref:Uncharacterized protein n=1 Tax=Aspergillus mulundensis TaxID=1810919 RepID=A0A3D8SJI3_9EURO|nr:Uncharacterized protein DSM5745_03129 [Aspergillus mulundensis]RDW86487.1 Uncharacterized protein DSM5745_03129 [Aspergillus mulundensis]
MIFHPPSWLPAIPEDLSKVGTVGEFVLRGPSSAQESATESKNPLVSADGTKRKSYRQLAEDVEALAAGLAQELQWSSNESAQGDMIIGIWSENTVDYHTYCFATHRLGGTSLVLHASTSSEENIRHLKASNCSVLIVSPALVEAGRAAAAALRGLRVYLTASLAEDSSSGFKTIEQLLESGRTLGPVPVLGKPCPIAYLCATSGTSGAQKLARLTHSGIITNILQMNAVASLSHNPAGEVALGCLPFSHVQGLVAALSHIYLRDELIVHPTFDMKAVLMSIQVHRINRLYVVPAILAALVANPFLFKAFDLSSVDKVLVGAGALAHGLYTRVKAAQPGWAITVGYGLTESSVGVSLSSPHEYLPGSIGVLLPLYQARLVREDGSEVEGFDEPGELLLASPNQAAGYLGDDEATATTFRDGWLHTGDVALFRQSPKGDAHLYIVDRLKDMIKVKGMQISPVAIEDCLRQHPGVVDVAVIGVPDYLAGERPKAFIVPAKKPAEGEVEALFDDWDEFVQSKLTELHWLRGRYELLEALPRTPSGKVTKGVLRRRQESKD